MDPLHLLESAFARTSFGLQVRHLATHHSSAAGGLRQDPNGGGTRSRNGLERQGQQRIADEQCRCFSVDGVAGRASPSQCVIIHARQVVMDKAVGVQTLNAHGCHQCPLWAAAGRRAAHQRENRAQSLAAGEEYVAHRLVQHRRRLGRRRQQLVESALDAPPPVRRERSQRGTATRCSHRCTTMPIMVMAAFSGVMFGNSMR